MTRSKHTLLGSCITLIGLTLISSAQPIDARSRHKRPDRSKKVVEKQRTCWRAYRSTFFKTGMTLTSIKTHIGAPDGRCRSPKGTERYYWLDTSGPLCVPTMIKFKAKKAINISAGGPYPPVPSHDIKKMANLRAQHKYVQKTIAQSCTPHVKLNTSHHSD